MAVDRQETGKPEIRDVVRARLRHELVLRSPPAAIAYIVAGVVLAWQNLNSVQYAEIMIVLGLLVAVSSVARFILAKLILKAPTQSAKLVSVHAFMIAINAVSWGITFGLITQESFQSKIDLLFPMIALSAFSAGAITSLSAIPWVLRLFAVSANGVPALVLMVGIVRGEISWMEGIYFSALLVQMIYVLAQGKQVRSTLIKQYEAEELLRREKIELQETNEDLRKTRRDLDIQTAKAQNSAKFAALGTMAGGVAHEINNPLAMIIGHVSHIMEKNESQDDDRSRFTFEKGKKITKAADRIATIFRGLRVFSREAEEDPFVKSSLRQIVDDTLSFCREKLARDGIKIEVDVDPALELECRPVQISQVLLNLLNNSADAVHTASEKKINIGAQDLGDTVLLKVEDSGPGVPKEIAQRVFEPFFTTKDVGKGTGLGLSISRSIAEDHLGELTLSADKANCFELRIPKRQVSQARDASQCGDSTAA